MCHLDDGGLYCGFSRGGGRLSCGSDDMWNTRPDCTAAAVFNGTAALFHCVSLGWTVGQGTYDNISNNVVRPVTMEGQKFQIPEDPGQTLPKRLPMDPIW